MTASAVSVALCTFNGERFIDAQVASILAQTLVPREVVVADDGSADGTLDILKRHAAQSSIPIRVLPATGRLGVTANFQRVVEAATGPLIALADQDDVWHPDRLAAAAAVFDADPAVLLVHSDARLVDAEGIDLGHTLMESLRPTRDEMRLMGTDLPLAAYLRRNLVTGTTVTFRRSLLDHALPFPPTWVHDEWLAVVASIQGRVRFLDRALVDYRQHGSNQIGVESPTLRRRLDRMLEPRGDRLARLAARADDLTTWVRSADGVPAETVRLIEAKSQFEQRRRAYPDARLQRIRPLLRQAGHYREFASQGRLDVLRDLTQKP